MQTKIAMRDYVIPVSVIIIKNQKYQLLVRIWKKELWDTNSVNEY